MTYVVGIEQIFIISLSLYDFIVSVVFFENIGFYFDNECNNKIYLHKTDYLYAQKNTLY